MEQVRTINTISENGEEYRTKLLTALRKGEKPRVVKSFNVGYKEFNDTERTITAYCTTVDRDRFGDTVQPAGMRNGNYRKNPVVLWAHNYTIPPIAKSLWEKPDAKGVRMKMQFDVREEAMEVYRLYKEGYLNAFSIGFLPIEYEQLFEGKTFTGFNFTEWELIENSAVPVPANPAALQDAYEKGIIHSDFLIRCFGETGILFGGETKPVQNSLGNNETINKTVETLELPMAFDPAALVDQIALREVSRIQGKLF